MGHQQYLSRELSWGNDNPMWDLHMQQSTAWRAQQSRSWKRKALRKELDTPCVLRGHKAGTKQAKPVICQ